MKEATIIGYGPAGVITAQRILESNPDLKISIFDSGIRSASFTQRTPFFLLNTRVQDMNVSDSFSFKDFLLKQGVSADDFVPRYLFGQYLDFFREKQKAHPQVQIYQRMISPDAAELSGKIIVQCIGEVQSNQVEVANKIVFNYPWDLTALSQIKPNSKILVVGTSLSFLDILSFLRGQGHLFTAISRSRVRLLAHPGSSEKVKITATSLRALVREFRSLNEHDFYGAVGTIRQNQSKLWQGFTPREKQQFSKWIAPFWRVQRHRAPPEMIQFMNEIENSGQLKFKKLKIQEINFQDYDCVINASGFQHHPGIATDHNYQTADKKYIVGMLNFKNHSETNSVPVFIQHAVCIANHIRESES